MDFKVGIFLVVGIFAIAAVVPMTGTDADESIFSYKSQLDDNGMLVYKEVAKATSIDEPTKTFTISFGTSNVFDDEEKAKVFANTVVQKALAAEYLSNPMIPYLWTYPVKEVQVDVEVAKIEVTKGDVTTVHYTPDKVTFSLSVPEGITADSMKELNDAINAFSVSGKTDADKVHSIISNLNKISYQKDDEGKISNIYDAIVKKKTTSAGVAQAFTLLCALNNIQSIIVAGENITAKEEAKNFWNYVYLEGDHSGSTYSAWYIVDSMYNASAGITGYQTTISYSDKTYSMSAALNTNLNLSSENDLKVPQTNDTKYVQVGGPSFLERYGEMLLIAVLGLVLVVGMLYAVKSGNY